MWGIWCDISPHGFINLVCPERLQWLHESMSICRLLIASRIAVIRPLRRQYSTASFPCLFSAVTNSTAKRPAPKTLESGPSAIKPRSESGRRLDSKVSTMAENKPLASSERDNGPDDKIPETKKLINLLRGWPSPATLPSALLQQAATKVLSDPAIYTPALQYGPDPGYQPLREALAAWLGNAYERPRRADELCITGGASQNIACVLASFTDPASGLTGAVWAAAPCYYLACPIFEDGGFSSSCASRGDSGVGGLEGSGGGVDLGSRLRGVPEDDQGIDVVWLGREMEAFDRAWAAERESPLEEEKTWCGYGYKSPGPHRKIYRHVIYVVATCANPSGKTMPLRRREALVRLARKHDALIISDDVYDFLQWEISQPGSRSRSSHPGVSSTSSSSLELLTPLVPRLSDIDICLGPSPHDPPGKHFGHAVSNGSFSKLVGPGIRTGWAHGTADFATGLSQTGATRSGGAPSQLAAAMMTEMLTSGALDEHLRTTVRPALRARHAAIVEAVRAELGPAGVDVVWSSEKEREVFGGYFVWLTLPAEGPDAGKVADRAKAEENLIVAPGQLFEVEGKGGVRFGRNIRLCFSWEDVADIEEGVRRLGRVLRRMRDDPARGTQEVEEETGLFK